jgi:hypothetical protein
MPKCDIELKNGTWTGFMLNRPDGTRHPLWANMMFAGGLVAGEARDEHGRDSAIIGNYNTAEREIHWVKLMKNDHETHFQGKLFNQGRAMAGAWRTKNHTGAFLIWRADEQPLVY